MKKFCSACGNQLELSQRFCNQCGAVNPFFITAFTLLSDQSDELEKLRLEKERIDKELVEKEERQAEFIRQEQLRKEAEESENLKLERLEKKKVKKDLELEKLESNLKEELLRVKEETIQHQKETIDLVKEVREELLQMEAGNKQLKEEIANLSKVGLKQKTDVSSSTPLTTVIEKSSKERTLMVSLLIILLGLTSFLAFFYFTNRYDNGSVQTAVVPEQEVVIKPADVAPITSDTMAIKDSITTADTASLQTIAITPVTPSKDEPKATVQALEREKPKIEFILTESKIIKDLIGKKISGCDIVVNDNSEIEQISNLVLVDKLSGGNLKYKFTAIIVQGNETFTAMPYIYYTSAGAFLKVDGTNCE